MRKRLLPFGIILLLAVLIAPVFRTVIREIIIIPLLYVFWLSRFFFQAVPQSVLWGIFLGICALILSIGLLGKQRSRLVGPTMAETPQGRIEGWVNLIDKASKDDYFKWRLAHRLQKLTLNAIAGNSGQSLKQTRQRLRRGELDIPPELQAYFEASLQSLGHLAAPSRFSRRKTTLPALDLDPIVVVQFLESLDYETANHILEINTRGEISRRHYES